MFYGNNNKEKQKHIVSSSRAYFLSKKNDIGAVLLIFIRRVQNTSATRIPPRVFSTNLLTGFPWLLMVYVAINSVNTLQSGHAWLIW